MPFAWEPCTAMSTTADECVITHGPEETMAVAEQLARTLGSGSVVALYGELGSGKTCFVQGLARGLGLRTPVTSPSFTRVREYPAFVPLYHIDLYRLQVAREVTDLGFFEYLESPGVVVIEWAERAETVLPPHTIRVTLDVGSEPHERRICIRRGQGHATCAP